MPVETWLVLKISSDGLVVKVPGHNRSNGYASIVASEQRVELFDRIGTLERDNMRLRGMLGVERQRVDLLA
ncbi:hypothetical protein Tco_0874194 [Tanacetum coccineum]|uniref:Transposase n=1 Tax=Tanacetum coccineum TaxID=301880 RepID=A0ABQ5BLP1_9ASTR